MFAGKKIWIIGSSSGIGAELAKSLSNQGAIIILSARDENKLNNIKASLAGVGHRVYNLDVVDLEKVKSVLQKILDDLGGIDSVIFMAGTYRPKYDDNEIVLMKQVVDVNLMGAINVIYSVLPIFKKQNMGQIVLCASVAGFRGLPNGQPYCATKAALISLAESLYVENKKFNIDIRLINPGFVKTRLTDQNNFNMPFLISPEEAANSIVSGLRSNKFEISFPKFFVYIMKILRMLPNKLYFFLANKF